MTDSDSNSPTSIDAVEFYWRPGCPFCSMLERDLNAARIPLAKHNIWDDPAAADFVRSVAGGDETVPTIFVAGRAMVNPPAAQVTELLNEVAPHLIPG
ncbi:MAG: glutaredoxin family protein [Acidimicrobiales bacterium]